MAERDKIEIPDGRFPSNSYSSIRPVTKAKPADDIPNKAIKGQAKQQKKTFGERIADAFLATDGKDIKDYFLFDVLIPGLKRGVEDLIHMLLYNDKKSPRVTRSYGESRVRRIGYNSIYDRRREDDEMLSQRLRAQKRDLIYETRQDAEEVLDMVADRIEDNGFATLKYLNAISGMPTDWTQTNWGWTSVAEASIVQVRDGWILKMPKLEEIR